MHLFSDLSNVNRCSTPSRVARNRFFSRSVSHSVLRVEASLQGLRSPTITTLQHRSGNQQARKPFTLPLCALK